MRDVFIVFFMCFFLAISVYSAKTINEDIKKANDEILSIQVNVENQEMQIKQLQEKLDEAEITIKKQQIIIQEFEELTSTSFHASAYTHFDSGCNTRTATGTTVIEGRTIAVDPSIIPLGSTVRIDSSYPGISGYYIAEDTGGAIKGNRVDIYMANRGRALDFGRRNVEVTVIGGK